MSKRGAKARKQLTAKRAAAALAAKKVAKAAGHPVMTANFDGTKWQVHYEGIPNGLERVLFVPDCHHPYADKRAWELLLKVAREFAPHIIVVLGDWVDNLSVNDHGFDEPPKYTLLGELAAAQAALVELAQWAGPQVTRKVFIEGNHETRLNRYIMANAPALHGLVDVQRALHLDELGWEFIPYKKTFRYGKMHITHDTGKSGKNAHRQSAQAYMGSALIGHTHRMAYDVTGTFEGTPYLAAMFGWLGDAEAAKYMHEAGAAEWVHGCGFGYRETATDIVHVTPVPFVLGKCMVEGQLLEAAA